MGVDGSHNFLRISDRLTTSGVVGATRLAGLSAEGYDAVVNLLPDESEHAVPDEADIVRCQGLDYTYIPVDFAAPTSRDLDDFTAALDRLEGRRVHVHCAANFRVTAFYGIHAVRRGLLRVADADELIGRIWNPAEHPVWAAFIEQARTTA